MLERPNILFVFTDQQRWDTCGYCNPNLNITPNLDALAADGTWFERAYTCQPVCGPARAALQTGLYPTETGNFHNLCRLEPGAQNTLANYLNNAGYQTGYIGKAHWALTSDGPVPERLRAGYRDCWKAVDVVEWASLPYEGQLYDEHNERIGFKGQYRVDFTTDLALDFLQSRDGSQPFFLMLSFLEPHHQNCMNRYVAPDGYAERYQNAWVPGDLASRPGMGDWEQNLPSYYGMIRRIDENLGRLVNALKANGQWENTILVFSSDHGSHFRTRNEEYKRACHEACTRIPVVFHGPGIKRGAVIRDELASLIDLPATFLELAGIDVPQYFHGLSLVPLLRGEHPAWRRAVLIQISESQVGRALCDGRYKYSVSAPGLDGFTCSYANEYIEEFLYDLQEDPDEGNNLVDAPQYASLRQTLRADLIALIETYERRTPHIWPR